MVFMFGMKDSPVDDNDETPTTIDPVQAAQYLLSSAASSDRLRTLQVEYWKTLDRVLQLWEVEFGSGDFARLLRHDMKLNSERKPWWKVVGFGIACAIGPCLVLTFRHFTGKSLFLTSLSQLMRLFRWALGLTTR